MLIRRQQSSRLDRRLGLGAGALGVSIFLATLLVLSLVRAWGPSEGASAPAGAGNWPLLLGREVQAQTQGSGSIQGIVRLQGRTSHLTVTIVLDGIAETTTDANGSYAFDQVAAGIHVINFSHQGYLSHSLPVHVSPGATATAPDVLLLGGDVAPPFGQITLDDLRLIASRIGSPDPEADVNGDELVNARDLTLAGRNFLRAAQGPTSSMDLRLAELLDTIRTGSSGAVEAAADAALDILYGGQRPLPSMGVPATEQAHKQIHEAEMALAQALRDGAQRRELAEGLRGRLLDLKFFVEEMNEVAAAAGQFTIGCGEGMAVGDGDPDNPCNQFVSILDEETGLTPGDADGGPQGVTPIALRPSYSVKLRSPVIPIRFTPRWEEDVQLIPAMAPGQCNTVFKETRGLMVRLHFERVTVVRDPWVTVFNVPRGTQIPIWAIEWVPSEYIKQFRLCNRGSGNVVTTVSQRVKQDVPLNFFWRFYR